MAFIRKIKLSKFILYYFGIRWVAYRFWYSIQLRFGITRRKFPAQKWEEQPLKHFLNPNIPTEPDLYYEYFKSNRKAFFFPSEIDASPQNQFSTWDQQGLTPQEIVDRLAAGEIRYFHNEFRNTGFPPNWFGDSFSQNSKLANEHWTDIAEFDYGDIKLIWEPSRFSSIYALVRAFWRTEDEIYAELFWKLIESWHQNNLPQSGANWKCGQEASIRLMAWIFGLCCFMNCPASSPKRISMLIQMIAISGHRINANIDYALSQRNNHGISEGTALWTIGVLFPELISSEEWERKGREVLEKLGCELIYVDGAFSQQSLNYQRLMLQLYLWCIRLGDLVERPFSHELRQKVGASGNLLYQVQFGLNGEVPTYGQNDGALILPLNNCDYTDYRPIIQAIHYLVHGTRCYEAGPWDEDLFWLFGDDGLTAPVALDRRTDWHSENSGYFVWRTKESSIFTRCGELRDRPAQADMLHVDLWWKGLNIAIDPGTYSYNEQPPWDNNPLGATRFHNSVTVDKQEQMERFGRFMWLPWVSGKEELNQQAFGGELSFWQGSHNGFLRLPDAVSYQRGIIRFDDEVWMIFDWLRGGQKHDYRLHWLFANWPYKWDVQKNNLILETPQGNYSARVGTVNKTDLESSIVNADTIANRGWRCQYYHKREPAISLEVIGRDTSIGFWTLFAPSDVQVNVNKYSVSNNSIDMEVKSVEWQATIIFHADLSLKSIVLNERSGFNQRLNIIS